MPHLFRVNAATSLLAIAGCLSGCIVASSEALAAQGCEPIRFMTPIDLGGAGQAYQQARKWRITMAVRSLHANQFIVGTTDTPTAGPNGEPSVIDIQTAIVDVAYSINSRYRLRVSVPFSSGRLTRKWPDTQHHAQTTLGLGDVSVSGEAWLWKPERHENGNIALGFGVKTPTGSHTLASKFYTATGAVDFPADQTIQPGDGGWAVTTEVQGFRRLTERLFGYASGFYMLSPRAKTEVKPSPTSTDRWSVPDIYNGRLGAAFSIWPSEGLSVSLGGRVDGIPKRDLIGGGNDSTVKRVSTITYLDPGLSWSRGRNVLTVSVPIRTSAERKQSELEQRTKVKGGGGFAKYLVFVSYSFTP